MSDRVNPTIHKVPEATDQRVWELYKQGLNFTAIRKRTGDNYLRIRTVIRDRHEVEHLPCPNFRIKRANDVTSAHTGIRSRTAA